MQRALEYCKLGLYTPIYAHSEVQGVLGEVPIPTKLISEKKKKEKLVKRGKIFRGGTMSFFRPMALGRLMPSETPLCAVLACAKQRDSALFHRPSRC